MAKAEKVNKSQAVRDYLKAHPGTANKEVAEALTKKGITITADYVATIKGNMKRSLAARQAVSNSNPTVTATERPAKPADTLTLEHVKAVAKMVKASGGFDRLDELLGAIKEVGGMKRFRDLMEAMAAPEIDDIPF